MFELTVESSFCAAHALTIAGVRERVHGHNWLVTATIESDTLDSDGLVCDFHTVQTTLSDVVAPFHNNDLNAVPPFDTLNPSAELVGKHIATELSRLLGEALAPHARVAAVRVTEAQGCAATYFMPVP